MNHYSSLSLYICGVGRIISIDYGLSRCGIAVTDPLQLFGQPLETVPTEKIIPFLKTYISEEEVDGIVLGIPYQLDGGISETTQMVFDFKKKLGRVFPDIPVHEVDERFTSKEAQRIVVQSVKSKKKRRNNKGLIDMVSASIILESYLNRNKLI